MISFLGTPKVQYFDNNGDPLSGGKVFVYLPGTTTKTNSFPTIADAIAGTNANANPVVLDGRGEANIVTRGPVKLVLTSSTDSDPPTSPIWTEDNYYTPNTVYDTNSVSLLDFTTAASAVNYLKIGNAAAGANPFIQSTGSDSTVGIDFKDKAGSTIFRLSQTASAVNWLTLSNAATGSGITVGTSGSDTNVPLTLVTQGTAALNLQSSYIGLVNDQYITDSSANEYLKFTKSASAVNEVTLNNAATGSAPGFVATGSDSNINIKYLGKGTGRAQIGSSGSNTGLSIFYSDKEQTHTAALSQGRSVTWPDADVTILTGASAGDQETGTSTTVSVTPAVQQRHASAAKVWVNYTTVSTTAILASYNVSSLTDGGTGITTISYTTAFSSVNYASVGMCGNASTSGNPVSLINISKGTGSIVVYNVNSSQTQADYSDMSVACFGDQ